MRFSLIAAVLAALGGCVDQAPPRTVDANPGWRAVSGAHLSVAEVEALKATCRPRVTAAPVDTDQPVASTIRDNPVYHPGGQGLGNAASTGIAAADRPLELGTRRAAYTTTAVNDCLFEKGLVQAQH